MENTRKTSKEIRSVNNFDLHIAAKQFTSNDLWYYTSAATASLILSNKCFHVSCFNEMNDLNEIRLHDVEKDIVHALCFVNSKSEKIPMWYLYGGITGKGVSIGFTPSVMLRFIRSIETVTPVGDKSTVLYRGRDFDLQYGWVYYCKKVKDTARYAEVFFKNKWYTVMDRDDFEKDNYFIKDYGWNYEKEFRLIFINKTNIPINKIRVEFNNDILKALKIRIAPEMDENIKNAFLTSEGMLSWSGSKIMESELGIKMDIIKRNKDSIIDYVKERASEYPTNELYYILSR